MMQRVWKDIKKPIPKTQRKSIRMQLRLFLYWSSMLLVILFAFLILLSVTGVFSTLDEEMQQILSVRQKNVVADISEQFDRITAQGISVSEQASTVINNYLFTDPVSSLNDDLSDNFFYEKCGRFPQIEEDETPYRLLCNEYPKVSN